MIRQDFTLESRAATTNGWSRSRRGRGPRDAREGRDAERGERVDDVQLALPEAVDDGQDEHQRGKRDEHVEHPHQHRVHRPAEVAGDHAQGPSDDQADGLNRGRHLEGHLAAVEDPGHDVVADVVGAEDVPGGPHRKAGVEDRPTRRRRYRIDVRPDKAEEEQQEQHRGGDRDLGRAQQAARPGPPSGRRDVTGGRRGRQRVSYGNGHDGSLGRARRRSGRWRGWPGRQWWRRPARCPRRAGRPGC